MNTSESDNLKGVEGQADQAHNLILSEFDSHAFSEGLHILIFVHLFYKFLLSAKVTMKNYFFLLLCGLL